MKNSAVFYFLRAYMRKTTETDTMYIKKSFFTFSWRAPPLALINQNQNTTASTTFNYLHFMNLFNLNFNFIDFLMPKSKKTESQPSEDEEKLSAENLEMKFNDKESSNKKIKTISRFNRKLVSTLSISKASSHVYSRL
jgi:hypothetical protein